MKEGSLVKTTLAVLILVLMGLGGIGIGIQLAHATNESSYRWGYQSSFNGYKEAIDNSDADFPSSNITYACAVYHNGVLVSPNGVTNQTACVDGIVNGWKDWCKTDMKDCLDNALVGYFPDVHRIVKSYP